MKIQELADKIANLFDIGELQDLCFRLNISYHDLSGQNRVDKARELVQYCERRGRINELVDLCESLRSHISWQTEIIQSSKKQHTSVHHQRKQEELKEHYDNLTEKLRLMREMLALETRVEEKLRYKKLIEQDEKARDEIVIEINDLKTRSVSLAEHSDLDHHRKIILNPIDHPIEIHCVFDNQAILGRSPGCDFYFHIAPAQVSNYHARIQYLWKTEKYSVQDLESTNGTYVNGELVERPKRISLGTTIQLGNTLTFLFEYYDDNPLSTGSLIYHTNDGKELARYIVVPSNRVAIGTTGHEAIKLPFLQPGQSVGYIEKESDGFYFIDSGEGVTNTKVKLENQMIFELASLKIRISTPK